MCAYTCTRTPTHTHADKISTVAAHEECEEHEGEGNEDHEVAPAVKAGLHILKNLVIPGFVKLVPELTRASSHRGEVPDMLHNELYPAEVCLCGDQFVYVAISLRMWRSARHCDDEHECGNQHDFVTISMCVAISMHYVLISTAL